MIDPEAHIQKCRRLLICAICEEEFQGYDSIKFNTIYGDVHPYCYGVKYVQDFESKAQSAEVSGYSI